MDLQPLPAKGFWESCIPFLTAFSLTLTPLFVAWMAYQSTSSTTSKDYVALAISILNSKDSPPANRKWATQLLSELSPVALPAEMRSGLTDGTELGGQVAPIRTVEVKVPIAMPCLNEKITAQVKAARPAPLDPATLPKDPLERQRKIVTHLVKLEGYAKMADIVVEACSTLKPFEKPEKAPSEPKGQSN